MDNNLMFQEFGEAAKLYSRYTGVIDQMQAAFQKDVDYFVNALFQSVQTELKTRTTVKLHENRIGKTRPTRRWWLADETTSSKKPYGKHAYVWLWTDRTEIVTPGTLQVSAYVWDEFKPFRHQLAAVKEEIQLTSECRLTSGIDGSLFTLEIAYGEKQPLAIAAPPIADLILRLHEAELRLPKR